MVLGTIGCNAEAEAKVALRKANLVTIGSAYEGFVQANSAAPQSEEEFISYLQESHPDKEAADEAVASLQEGNIIVIWKGTWPENAAQSSTIVAFEANVPGSGGYAVTAAGQVELVTAGAFAERETLATK